MEAAAPAFKCLSCSAAYGRLGHLHRHTQTAHSTDKPFPCPYCTQAFGRRDVLLRHSKTCKAKPDDGALIPVVAAQQRGRKRKSCDSCARQKKACNGTQPCLPCLHRKQACVFTTLPDRPASNASNTPGGRTDVERWLQSTADSDEVDMLEREDETSALHDDPLATGEYENSSTTQAAEAVSCTAEPGAQHVPHTFSHDRSLTLDTSVRRLEFLSNFTEAKGLVSTFDCGTIELRAIFSQCLSDDIATSNDAILAEKCQQIVTAIKDSLAFLATRDTTRSPSSESLQFACGEFFAPPQLSLHLASYWALWHPNCPFIHRQTFEVQTAPSTLLAAMALLGACLSPTPGDREAALLWLDPVEEWVFSAPEFSDSPLDAHDSGEHSSTLRRRLDALRSAYCMVLLQTWEGNDTANRRARRSRYTDIIGVFRSVCNQDISHGNLSEYVASDQAWKAFALTEELIRTLTYVMLLDTAYVIFNNTPPRMAPGEARVALTCPEACFQADNVQAWISALQLWKDSPLGRTQPLVHQVTSMLWQKDMALANKDMLCSMGSLNFFTMVHPLHVQLFHARCHPMPATQTSLVRRALDAWRSIWLQRTSIKGLEEHPPSNAVDCWKRLGFARYAPEFWCLADIVLHSSEQPDLQTYDQCGGSKSNSSITQLLSRYDVSDMSQVQKLVDLFGSMQLAT